MIQKVILFEILHKAMHSHVIIFSTSQDLPDTVDF